MMVMSRFKISDNQTAEDSLDLDPSLAARFERAVRNALPAMLALTALAFGTVEYWSIAVFGGLIVLLFILWGVRQALVRTSQTFFPLLLLPLLLAIIYGLGQVVTTVDANGRHWALSMDPEATWLVIEVMSVLLLAGLLIANLFHTRHRLLLLRNFLIAFGLAYAIFALINHFTWNGRYFWVVDPTIPSSHPFGSFVNHNHFAGFVEMLAPLPLALVLTRTVRSELAVINAFAATLLSIATALSLSRGGMISLLSGLLFTVVLSLRRPSHAHGNQTRLRLILTRALISFIILVVLAVGILWVSGDAVIQRLEVPSPDTPAGLSDPTGSDPARSGFYQSRGFIWEDTIRMIRENWLIGVGLGAYQTAYPIYSLQDRLYLVGQSHNDYLQIVADGGILLALLAIFFLILLLRSAAKAIDHPDITLASLAVGCCGGIFALLVHGMFDFNFQITSNSLLFLTLSMIVWRIGFMSVNKRVSLSLIEQSRKFDPDPFATTEMEVRS